MLPYIWKISIHNIRRGEAAQCKPASAQTTGISAGTRDFNLKIKRKPPIHHAPGRM